MVTLGVVFDVDDTLYLERDYVRSGLGAVAAHVANVAGIDAAEVAQMLWSGFEAGVRGSAFNRLLEKWPQIGANHSVAELVDVYRSHPPGITLGETERLLIKELKARSYHIGVISDGPTVSQKAKVAALGLDRLADVILLTGSWPDGFGKPHPRAFEEIADLWRLSPDRMVYVGDNPLKDFVGPRRLGWRSVRLRRPGQLHAAVQPPSPAHEPDVEIADLADMLAIIASWT